MMLYLRVKKFLYAFLAIFVFMGRLNAEWNPECLPIENENQLNVLKNPSLIDVENRVLEYVKNSWCSQEKAKLILELVVITQPKVCVEIGAFTGSSTLPMLAGLQYLKHGHAYIIDAWSNEEAIRGWPIKDPNTEWWSSLDMPILKNHCIYMIDSWSLSSYCHVLHMTSQKAVSQIPSIDFLHLDGNPAEAGALLDSELYLPKVVPGGYVLLSNALVMLGEKPTKMKALWPIFDQCDIVWELENGNTLLFRKK